MKNVIKHYLRDKLNYEGLVISDDMVMGGIKGFSSLDACIRGINAGINMFIFRTCSMEILDLILELEKAAKTGLVNLENIDKSVEIITRVKCF